MRKFMIFMLSVCLLLVGCSSSSDNNGPVKNKKVQLNFEETDTMSVSSTQDRLIAVSEEKQLVDNIIKAYKSYTFKRIDKVDKEVLYALMWVSGPIDFDSSYNIKFRYDEAFFKQAYNELFNNSSVESIQILDEYTIIYQDEYYKSNEPLNLDVIKALLETARDYRVSVFVPNEYFDSLEEKEMIIKDLDEQTIIKELINVGVLPDFVKINEVKINNNTVYIDFNQDIIGFFMTMGNAGESLIVKSLVNSYIKTFNIEQVQITVDQKVLETAYDIYDKPLQYMP